MKINIKRLYTHPVLSEERDDYKTCQFSVERKFSLDAANNVIFDMKFSTDCAEILELVRSGKAKYLLHVECPTTLYREIFEWTPETPRHEISMNRLKGKIYCVAFIVAVTDIKNFSCIDWNNDFGEMKFDLPKNSVLAYKNLNPLVINEDPKLFKNVASIFTISKRVGDKNLKPFDVDMDGHKINIILSENEFDKYRQYRSNRRIQLIMNAMIILPTLVHVFERLQEDGVNNDFDTYGECNWFMALERAYQKRGMDFKNLILAGNDALTLAQIAMQYPLSKALDALSFVLEEASTAEGDD